VSVCACGRGGWARTARADAVEACAGVVLGGRVGRRAVVAAWRPVQGPDGMEHAPLEESGSCVHRIAGGGLEGCG